LIPIGIFKLFIQYLSSTILLIINMSKIIIILSIILISSVREIRCDAKNLAFLEDVFIETQIQSPIDDVFIETQILSPIDDVFIETQIQSPIDDDFIETSFDDALVIGFLEGIEIFSNLPHEKECKINDPKLIKDITAVIDILKDIKKNHGIKVVTTLIAIIKDAYERLGHLQGGCQAYGKELQEVILKLIEHVSSPKYVAELAVHTIISIRKIKKLSDDASKKKAQGDLKAAGKDYGQLAHLIFLWNFKN
jgi:hypothetical protein